MRKPFEDVKHIRSRHLTGLGAATYGSLVRALLARTRRTADAPRRGRAKWLPRFCPISPVGPCTSRIVRLSARQLCWPGLRRQADRAGQIQLIGSELDAELAAWRTATNVVSVFHPIASAISPGCRHGRIAIRKPDTFCISGS